MRLYIKVLTLALVGAIVGASGASAQSFTDVASSAGVALGGSKFGGIGWADFNQDGCLDQLATRRDSPVVYYQNRNGAGCQGTFRDVTNTHAAGLQGRLYERSAITVDLSQDGIPDFVVNTAHAGLAIFINRGAPNYTFGTATQQPNQTFNAWATGPLNTEGIVALDVEPDGDLDLVIESHDFGMRLLRNNGSGVFTELPNNIVGFPSSGAIGDFASGADIDGDGRVDVVARRNGGNAVESADLFFRTGAGTVGSPFFAASVAFNEETDNYPKGSVTICDFNNDGLLDVHWTPNILFMQTAPRVFSRNTSWTSSVPAVGSGSVCFDADNDGDLDLVVTSQTSQVYYRNNTPTGGAPNFAVVNVGISAGDNSWGGSAADYDRDGDVDLAVTTDNRNRLWRNNLSAPARNAYLHVDVRAAGGGARKGVGASVRIESCGGVAEGPRHFVSGGDGRGSTSDGIHLGLANRDLSQPFVIRVRYPDGSSVLKAVIPNMIGGSYRSVTISENDSDDLSACGCSNNSECGGGTPFCEVVSRECVACLNNGHCSDSNDCTQDRCTNGMCSNPPLAAGEVCMGGTCNGAGACTGCANAADCNDGNDCTDDACNAGVCSNPPKAVGEACASGMCNGSGMCVGCTADSQCNDNNSCTNDTCSAGMCMNMNLAAGTMCSGGMCNDSGMCIGADKDQDGVDDESDADDDNDGIPDIVELGGVDHSKDTNDNGIADFGDAAIQMCVDRGDGVCAMLPFTVDFDQDGIPNHFDLDSDGDSLLDTREAGHGALDADDDGVLDSTTDADNDGLLDSVDADDADMTNISAPTPDDHDGDTHPDFLDLDSDDDGIRDSVERLADPDMDGTPAYLDLDSDDDGVADNVEGHDADQNGAPDTMPMMVDANNNGLDDAFEDAQGGTEAPTPDRDGDGDDDYLDADDDGDGIPTNQECTPGNIVCEDTDGDSTPDYLDLDSDDDGLSDDDECDEDPCRDFDMDMRPDFRDPDDDGDGLPTRTEVMDQQTHGTPDGDGDPAWLDDDSDGDGAPDRVEGTTDADMDGVPDYLDPNSIPDDTDGDGINDILECEGPPSDACRDSDDDGRPDYLDIDDDNDGIITAVECELAFACTNTDGDDAGLPDYLDLDSDNDGLPDLLEGHDADNDGVADHLPSGSDDDMDGLDNAFDPDSGGVMAPTPDQDGDGKANYRDVDSDGDGLSDLLEANDANNDGVADRMLSSTDTDNDGLDDAFDADHGGSVPMKPDFDQDGIPNYLDKDSDGDGISDLLERSDVDRDGTPDVIPQGVDQDGDGLDDAFDPDLSTVIVPPDHDGDGAPNYIDIDSDGDNIPDTTEALDVDHDGQPDLTPSGNDSDRDGLDDAFDPDEGVTLPNAPDTDADGVPDYLDVDSDGDGIEDARECSELPCINSDDDRRPDYLDTDSDDDGIDDAIEGHDDDHDGSPDTPPSGMDTDGDGLDDAYDTDNGGTTAPLPDVDNDGAPDYRDADSDNDGRDDKNECPLGGGMCPDSDGNGVPDYLQGSAGGAPAGGFGCAAGDSTHGALWLIFGLTMLIRRRKR